MLHLFRRLSPMKYIFQAEVFVIFMEERSSLSEQDGTQSLTKQRPSRKTSSTNQQHDKQTNAAQRPANDDTEPWKAYWQAQGQPWRTEPEIDLERKHYLAERRNIKPDIKQGIYPFKDIKLSRADVEWLFVNVKSKTAERLNRKVLNNP